MKESNSFKKPPTGDELTDVLLKANDYWQHRQFYSEVKDEDTFCTNIVEPMMNSVRERRSDFLRIIVAMNIFNESWCDSEDRYRLSFLKSLHYTGLHISRVSEMFNTEFHNGLCDPEQLTSIVEDSSKSAVRLFELLTEPSQQDFFNYCLKRAQLILAEMGCCPFDYYDDEKGAQENIENFKDNNLEKLEIEVKKLQSRLPFSVIESLKSTNFGVYEEKVITNGKLENETITDDYLNLCIALQMFRESYRDHLGGTKLTFKKCVDYVDSNLINIEPECTIDSVNSLIDMYLDKIFEGLNLSNTSLLDIKVYYYYKACLYLSNLGICPYSYYDNDLDEESNLDNFKTYSSREIKDKYSKRDKAKGNYLDKHGRFNWE